MENSIENTSSVITFLKRNKEPSASPVNSAQEKVDFTEKPNLQYINSNTAGSDLFDIVATKKILQNRLAL